MILSMTGGQVAVQTLQAPDLPINLPPDRHPPRTPPSPFNIIRLGAWESALGYGSQRGGHLRVCDYLQ